MNRGARSGISWSAFRLAGSLPTGGRCRAVGLGVNEIRVREDRGAFRVIYVVKFAEAVYVLHAFQKTTPKTSKQDVDLARRRFRELIQERKQR